MDSTHLESRPAWSRRWTAATLLSVVPVILTAVLGPQSGLETMIILLPWAGMLVAHACFGPAALFTAWREGRRVLFAFLALYLTVFSGVHLAWLAAASDIPEKLETEYVRRYRPADYELQRLAGRGEDGPSLVGKLVAAGADVNRIGPKGWTPLFGAVGGSPRLAIALLEAGANPDIRSESGSAPLHLAVRQGQVEVVAALLAHGGDPDLLDDAGQSALCRVMAQGIEGDLSPDRLSMLRSLLEAGADANGPCRAFSIAVGGRQTSSLRMLLDAGHRNDRVADQVISRALATAARARPRDLEWLTLVLEAGADPNPAMKLAVEHGDEALLALLLEGGADPNSGHYLNRTAGIPERDGLTELLLRHGADPGLGDDEGRSGFVEAARNAHDANVRRFAALGADLNVSWRGEPLLLALHTMIPKRKHIPALLVELGADVNMHGNEGHTPLMRATISSHHALMTVLIEAGANLDSVDAAGRTALHHAAETQFEASRVLAQLLDSGAAIEARDGEGRTPLCLAQAARNEPIAAALEARGAQPQACARPSRSHRIPITRPGKR